MLNKKTIGVALACALALGAWSGTTLATTIGGVTWDPTNGSDLTIQALNFREASVAAVGDILTGYGQIGSINGDTSFCAGCSLTFIFTYTVKDIDLGIPTNPKVTFDTGSIDFWVDAGGTFDVDDPTTAGIGTPWLNLLGHTASFTGFTALGQLYSTINGPVADPGSLSGGFGLLDVDLTGGPAGAKMDTNLMADGADFDLSTAFSTKIFGSCAPTIDPTDICHYPIVGTGTLTGKSVVVPEPGAAGLLGLGLGFLGFLTWKRSKESDEQA